jgi:hypothetical protein
VVRETWLLHQPLGSRFAIQPIPVFTAAFADYGALRTELGPALIRSARWLLDPARLAITEEFPTPPIVGDPNGQLIEGSWEILHRPVVGSATGERRVGLEQRPEHGDEDEIREVGGGREANGAARGHLPGRRAAERFCHPTFRLACGVEHALGGVGGRESVAAAQE